MSLERVRNVNWIPDATSPTRETLWVIIASSTLTVMAGSILSPVVPQIQSNLGVSESLAGLIITTHSMFIVLMSPVVGALIDRIGPRWPFILGLVLYAIGGGAGLIIDQFVPLLLTRAVLGIGVAFVYTGVTVLIYDLYEGAQLDRAFGLRGSANTFGAAIWPLIGGALGTLTWNAPFAVYLVAMPLGVLALLTVPDTARGSGTGHTDSVDPETKNGLAGLAAVFQRRPTLLLVYLLYLFANVLLYGIVVFYPQALSDVGITSSMVISLYLAGLGMAGSVSALLYDRVKRRVGRHAIILATFALWTVALAFAVFVSTPLTSLVPPVLFGLGMGMITPSVMDWVEELAPKERQGSLSSYLASAGYLGQFASPILFSPITATYGIRGVFGAAAGIALLGLGSLGVVLVRRR